MDIWDCIQDGLLRYCFLACTVFVFTKNENESAYLIIKTFRVYYSWWVLLRWTAAAFQLFTISINQQFSIEDDIQNTK